MISVPSRTFRDNFDAIRFDDRPPMEVPPEKIRIRSKRSRVPMFNIISDNFPPGVAGTKCLQSGIRIPDSRREYKRQIEAMGFYQQ